MEPRTFKLFSIIRVPLFVKRSIVAVVKKERFNELNNNNKRKWRLPEHDKSESSDKVCYVALPFYLLCKCYNSTVTSITLTATTTPSASNYDYHHFVTLHNTNCEK